LDLHELLEAERLLKLLLQLLLSHLQLMLRLGLLERLGKLLRLHLELLL
jgi:hypothetical protein